MVLHMCSCSKGEGGKKDNACFISSSGRHTVLGDKKNAWAKMCLQDV